jgi:hypothetical protein
MKAIQVFVIATGAIIVLGLLALFAIGRRPGAGRVGGTVELGVPPAVAMQWLTEPAKLRRWVGWLAEVKGDTTAAALGRKQEWVMDDGRSGALTLAVEITGWAPPDSMRMTLAVPGMVEGDNRYVLEDLLAGTRLTVTGKYRHPNLVVALLEPLVTPEAQAKLSADLARLRAAIATSADTASAAAAPADTTAAPH